MPYLKEQAYEILHDKIINCVYEPGAVLNETILMEDLGVSRTPIREALNRLSMENLVTRIPKKGILVTGISIEDMVQVYNARIIVEPQLILLYGDKFSREALEALLVESQNAKTPQQHAALDERFYSMIYNICSNRYLREMFIMMEGHNHRNRIWRSNEIRVHLSAKERDGIIRAVLDEDYPLASELLNQHLANAREYAIQKYF